MMNMMNNHICAWTDKTDREAAFFSVPHVGQKNGCFDGYEGGGQLLKVVSGWVQLDYYVSSGTFLNFEFRH